jgi:hypothetical protein
VATSASPPSNPKPAFNEGAVHSTAPSRFCAPDPADCPADIRAVMEETRAKIGFIPNVFLAYAKRPDHFRAYLRTSAGQERVKSAFISS